MPILVIKVKPRASKSALLEQPDGTWVAWLKSPPVEGKANEELIALIAAHFGCRKEQVILRSGATSRIKQVEVKV